MSRREKEIRMKVSDEEYKIIQEKAEEANMQVAPYIRWIAQNPTIIKIDYSIISAHTTKIAEIRDAINRLVFTIEATNNYLPKEIESIVNLMEELFKSENELLKTIRNSREKQM